jgi:hypothetical protein
MAAKHRLRVANDDSILGPNRTLKLLASGSNMGGPRTGVHLVYCIVKEEPVVSAVLYRVFGTDSHSYPSIQALGGAPGRVFEE